MQRGMQITILPLHSLDVLPFHFWMLKAALEAFWQLLLIYLMMSMI